MARRLRTALALTAAALLTPILFAAPAAAGNAHFVDDTVQAAREGDALTVTGKIAGLGDEPQVHVVLTATASCINPGGQHPQAGNKETVTAEGDFPVQNGRAEFSLTVVAVFQPSCSPPMSVAFTDVTVSDVTSGISLGLPGVF
jgi:hypothetical protein